MLEQHCQIIKKELQQEHDEDGAQR